MKDKNINVTLSISEAVLVLTILSQNVIRRKLYSNIPIKTITDIINKIDELLK